MTPVKPKVTILLRCTRHGYDGDPEYCRGCIERTGVMRFFVLWFFAAVFFGLPAAAVVFWIRAILG